MLCCWASGTEDGVWRGQPPSGVSWGSRRQLTGHCTRFVLCDSRTLTSQGQKVSSSSWSSLCHHLGRFSEGKISSVDKRLGFLKTVSLFRNLFYYWGIIRFQDGCRVGGMRESSFASSACPTVNTPIFRALFYSLRALRVWKMPCS